MSFARALVPVALLATLAAGASAASPAPNTLSGVVQALEARYPGQVTAIELDAAGDRPAHFHVDMRFPESGVARLDVDAVTLAVASREPAATAPATPFVYAVALVGSAIDGRVVGTRFDDTNGAPAHYDVDVALPSGAVARLKVDAATGVVGWRTPAIAAE
ncbi:MAG: hypothetical protein U1F10_07030 [Burkholderiales bacterium]